MLNKIFESNQSTLLKKALNVYQKQHEAISKNVANASNRDYQRVNTDFSHELELAKKSRLQSTHQNHFRSGIDKSTNSHPSVENTESVDLSEEMVNLAENQIKYEFTTRMLNRLYRGISTSITGRIK